MEQINALFQGGRSGRTHPPPLRKKGRKNKGTKKGGKNGGKPKDGGSYLARLTETACQMLSDFEYFLRGAPRTSLTPLFPFGVFWSAYACKETKRP